MSEQLSTTTQQSTPCTPSGQKFSNSDFVLFVGCINGFVLLLEILTFGFFIICRSKSKLERERGSKRSRKRVTREASRLEYRVTQGEQSPTSNVCGSALRSNPRGGRFVLPCPVQGKPMSYLVPSSFIEPSEPKGGEKGGEGVENRCKVEQVSQNLCDPQIAPNKLFNGHTGQTATAPHGQVEGAQSSAQIQAKYNAKSDCVQILHQNSLFDEFPPPPPPPPQHITGISLF